MNEFWIEFISKILLALIPTALMYIGQKIIDFLKNKNIDEENQKFITKAYSILNDCVIYVNQTFVESLKREGNFNAELGKQAKALCEEKF